MRHRSAQGFGIMAVCKYYLWYSKGNNIARPALIKFEPVCTDPECLDFRATNANTDGSARTYIGHLLERTCIYTSNTHNSTSERLKH